VTKPGENQNLPDGKRDQETGKDCRDKEFDRIITVIQFQNPGYIENKPQKDKNKKNQRLVVAAKPFVGIKDHFTERKTADYTRQDY